jgi:hypothetical protein
MWKRVKGKGKIPSLRNCVAGTATGSVFVMFGGLGLSEKERFNDVYVFNPLGICLLYTVVHSLNLAAV